MAQNLGVERVERRGVSDAIHAANCDEREVLYGLGEFLSDGVYGLVLDARHDGDVPLWKSAAHDVKDGGRLAGPGRSLNPLDGAVEGLNRELLHLVAWHLFGPQGLGRRISGVQTTFRCAHLLRKLEALSRAIARLQLQRGAQVLDVAPSVPDDPQNRLVLWLRVAARLRRRPPMRVSYLHA